MFRSDLCECSGAYIVVKERISVRGTNDAKRINKNLTFKNDAPFISCMSNTFNTFIDNAEDLDIVMPMYNLLEYSDNYSMTSGSLWNYYRDEVNDDENENDNANNKINNNKAIASKSFEYTTKIIGSSPNNNNILDAEVVVSLKYLINFWRCLDLPLIKCEIKLDLRWTKNFVISKISRIFRAGRDPPVQEVTTQTTGATSQINNAKLYVLVVTLPINDIIKFLENVKQGFKRTISWNKYRFEITTQTKSNNLDYLIDPTFKNIDRLFILSFKNVGNDPTRYSFDKYYMLSVEIKDCNALIDNKPFFDQPVKNKQEAYEKLIKMSRNNDYTTGNLLDYLYYQNYYKLTGIDLSRQTNTSIPQKINFTGKLEEDDVATMFFITKHKKILS